MEPVAIKPLENVTDARLLTSQKESFSYGLVKYGIPITKSNFKYGSGSATIYTIPEGKLFFLTFLNLSCWFSSGVVNADYSSISSNDRGTILNIHLPDKTGDYNENIALNLTQPILFYGGDVIKVNSSTSQNTTGVIGGYEIDASMKDQFI